MKDKSLQANSQKLKPKEANPRRPDMFLFRTTDTPWYINKISLKGEI